MSSPKVPAIRFIAITLIAGALTTPASAQVTVLQAEKDATFRTDVSVRRNDNYGCTPYLMTGGSRGGGGIPFGGPDGIRSVLQFDLSGNPGLPVGLAVLELTLAGFDNFGGPQVHQIDIHRVLEPWDEGNGIHDAAPVPPGCVDVDSAHGVAWVGNGDGGDVNNQTQPAFDPIVSTRLLIDESVSAGPGTIYEFDVTDLVNRWITGAAPNYGMLLRDPVSDGTFRQIAFSPRELDLFVFNWAYFPLEVPGPRLKLYQTISVEPSSWGRIKAFYR